MIPSSSFHDGDGKFNGNDFDNNDEFRSNGLKQSAPVVRLIAVQAK